MVLLDLNVKNVLALSSKREIMEAFFGTNKIYGCFSSPLRKDEHPSFSINRKSCKYIDHVSKETGDCFDLIMKYHNVDMLNALYVAINLVGIGHRFNTSVLQNNVKQITLAKPEINDFVRGGEFEVLDLNVTIREWEDHDLEYWQKYNINLNILKLGKVFPISKYFLNDLMYVADKYAYVFAERKDNKVTLKVYQPFRETGKGKWINNNTFDVWELYNLIPPKGKKLVITSSRKDALAILSNSGFPSTSFQAEGTRPKQHVLDNVVQRFDEVYVLYDNDKKGTNWGQEHAAKLCALNPKLINIKIPDRYKSKDFSDLIIEIGRIEATRVLYQLLNVDGY